MTLSRCFPHSVKSKRVHADDTECVARVNAFGKLAGRAGAGGNEERQQMLVGWVIADRLRATLAIGEQVVAFPALERVRKPLAKLERPRRRFVAARVRSELA